MHTETEAPEMPTRDAEWFAEWFDSPYYHLLYGHRSQAEADALIEVLAPRLGLAAGAAVLDLACGKGRHARALHRQGYRVLGVDLSPQSIAHARQYEADGLHYEVADMRHLGYTHRFDAVLNLFTSFGYFSTLTDNLRVLAGVKASLKPGGRFVLDFMNADQVAHTLVPQEVLLREGIRFDLRRRLIRGYVHKDIRFRDAGQSYHYQERVQLLTEPMLRNLLIRTGFTVLARWGDYSLSPFRTADSPRLIFLCQA
ncbi:MAG: class I SAM-dependent methyltransferase [Sphingobacteriia bacterium]